jgi:hypothetical protein
MSASKAITDIIGAVPYRMAFAGGWIDQPFVSRHDPNPPGSMVVVALEPTFRYLDRAGMATSTRIVALRLWGGRLPDHEPAKLVRELYEEENRGRGEPSGSQDMVGLVYPGVSRLDFDFRHEAGIFPAHIESCNDRRVAAWLERVVHLVPIAQRPDGYNPLESKNLDPLWIRRLGASGRECYQAIVRRDLAGFGASLNESMACWQAILPGTVRHPALTVDLPGIMHYYQSRYAGAMYSGCGGGYLYVASDRPVPGALRINVRISARGSGKRISR